LGWGAGFSLTVSVVFEKREKRRRFRLNRVEGGGTGGGGNSLDFLAARALAEKNSRVGKVQDPWERRGREKL